MKNLVEMPECNPSPSRSRGRQRRRASMFSMSTSMPEACSRKERSASPPQVTKRGSKKMARRASCLSIIDLLTEEFDHEEEESAALLEHHPQADEEKSRRPRMSRRASCLNIIESLNEEFELDEPAETESQTEKVRSCESPRSHPRRKPSRRASMHELLGYETAEPDPKYHSHDEKEDSDSSKSRRKAKAGKRPSMHELLGYETAEPDPKHHSHEHREKKSTHSRKKHSRRASISVMPSFPPEESPQDQDNASSPSSGAKRGSKKLTRRASCLNIIDLLSEEFEQDEEPTQNQEPLKKEKSTSKPAPRRKLSRRASISVMPSFPPEESPQDQDNASSPSSCAKRDSKKLTRRASCLNIIDLLSEEFEQDEEPTQNQEPLKKEKSKSKPAPRRKLSRRASMSNVYTSAPVGPPVKKGSLGSPEKPFSRKKLSRGASMRTISSIPEENHPKEGRNSPTSDRRKVKRTSSKKSLKTKDGKSKQVDLETHKVEEELLQVPSCSMTRPKPRRRASMSSVSMSCSGMDSTNGLYGSILLSQNPKSMSDVVESIISPQPERSMGYIIPSLHGAPPMHNSLGGLVPSIPEEPTGTVLTPPRPQRKEIGRESMQMRLMANERLPSRRCDSPPRMASFMQQYY